MKRIYSLLLCIFLAKLGFGQCGFTVSIAQQVNIHCNGIADGSAVGQTNGGTWPFTYAWKSNGTVIGTSTSINSLVPGVYWFFATDQSACTDSVSVTITEPTPLIVTPVNTVPATCGMSNGTVTFAGMGGTPPYTYFFDQINSGSGTFTNLSPGTYSVIVADANGCQAFNTVTIVNQAGPTVTISSTPAQCGMCDGTASAMPSGGTAPYAFSWSNFPVNSSTQVAQNLCGNTAYTCTVTDANGCVATNTVMVQTTGTGSVSTSVIPSACGQNNGSVTVTSAPGLTPPLLYSIQGGAFQASASFTSLGSGTYTIVVSGNGGGCTANTLAIVSDSSFNVQLTPTMPTCNMCDGSIATGIVGGTGPYTYQWSNNSQSANPAGLCTGNYFVEVTDSNGCYTAASVAIAPVNAPVIQVDTVINASCAGNGSAQISVTGGTGAYTYVWQPGGLTTANPGLAAGSYTVTVSDGGGCTSSQQVYIGNNTTVYVSGTVNNINCGSAGMVTANGYGGTPPYSFLWSNGSTANTLSSANSGIYSVTIVDQNGCSGTGSFFIPSNCFNYVTGHVYNDANQNCVQDMGENGLANGVVATNMGFSTMTDSSGYYMLYTSEMNPVISTYPFQYYTPTCPAAGITATFTQLGDTISNADFGFYADPNYFDLGIHPGWSAGHPGMQKQYWVMVENNSPTAQNAVVTFIYDPVLQYDSCNNGGVHYPAQHKIEWTFNNLPAGYYWGSWNSRPMAYFTVPASASLNTQLQTYFEITPVIGDAYTSNNTLSITEPVTGSHDPNEKSVIPHGNGPAGEILRSDSTLLYTIHFQNNGNDTAFTVVVVDTLSPNLDITTLVPGASSHPYTFSLSGQGVMTWRFDHIMLPDSTRDPVGSNGYFNYTVRQQANLPFGTEIRNTAHIFFDFNSAVVTNTTLNTIVAPVGLEKLRSENGLILYPNPAANEVMVQFETKVKGDMQLRMYSIVGTLVKEQKVANMQAGINVEKLDISGLQNGLYLVEVSDGNSRSVKKLVIQK
jgi:uncharacterized repeat protein (TIGR01451 family)